VGPDPSALDLFGTERLAMTLTGPELGRLRSVVALEVDGDRLLATGNLELDAALTEEPSTGRFALEGRLATPMGSANLGGTISPVGLAAQVADGAGAGVLRGARLTGEASDAPLPLDDYGALARAVRSVLGLQYVDARELARAQAQRFQTRLEQAYESAGDDFDALTGFARALEAWPGVELALQRPDPDALPTPVASAPLPLTLGETERYVTLAELGDAEAIDSVLGDIDLAVETLVLDLRGEGTADLHLLRCAPWLDVEPEALGTWSTNALHRDGAVPDPDAPLPSLPLADAVTREAAFLPGRFRIDPGAVERPLEAEVRVLLDARSGGGAVALATALAASGRGQAMGALPEHPGELARSVALPSGFVLRLPVAQRLDAEGRPIREAPPALVPYAEGVDPIAAAFGRDSD
jgi:hypothetical protein